jgi:hypothetical protein
LGRKHQWKVKAAKRMAAKRKAVNLSAGAAGGGVLRAWIGGA